MLTHAVQVRADLGARLVYELHTIPVEILNLGARREVAIRYDPETGTGSIESESAAMIRTDIITHPTCGYDAGKLLRVVLDRCLEYIKKSKEAPTAEMGNLAGKFFGTCERCGASIRLDAWQCPECGQPTRDA